MIKEIVWSPIKDTNKSNIANSPIWNQCFRDEEVNDDVFKISNTWYKYIVKFDGLKPIQVTSMKTIKGNRNDGTKNKKSNIKRDDRR